MIALYLQSPFFFQSFASDKPNYPSPIFNNSIKMKRSVTTLLILFLTIFSQAQENLSYFLPGDVTYNSDIPTPEEFFGQKMGEWHLTHDQVLFYIQTIAKVPTGPFYTNMLARERTGRWFIWFSLRKKTRKNWMN